MKIQYSALVGSTSGKLNGSVASHNKGGAYVRNKGIVANPRTLLQQAQRSIFSSIATQWRNLTEVQRTNWQASAATFPYQDKLQETRILSGFGLFQKFNTVLIGLGKPLLVTPPVKTVFPNLFLPAFTLNVDLTPGPAVLTQVVQIDFDNQETTEEISILVDFTAGMSPGINNPGSRFKRYPGYSNLPATTSGTFNGSGVFLYEAVYGIPTPGGKVFCRFTPVNAATGEMGVPILVSTIVTES